MYYSKSLQNTNKVTIEVHNAPLITVLDACFKNQPVTYRIEGKTIIIKEQPGLPARPAPAGSDNADTTVAITGKVTSAAGVPLIGATVKVKGTTIGVATGADGQFALAVPVNTTLTVSYVGFKTKEAPIPYNTGRLNIELEESATKLNAVDVSTGYQTLPRERATGSFDAIGEKLINRSVGTNILDRLNGVASGVTFNGQQRMSGNLPAVSVRGISTLFANKYPLVILNNFPYDGNLGDINPNDITSVTVLKDAAAASIWGVRAGNGVIVLTTKTGSYNHKAHVSLNSNVTVSGKPDVYSVPQLSPGQFIDVERYLYGQGNYDLYLQYLPYYTQSPVVDILYNRSTGLISASDAASQLNALSKNDLRRDLSRYYYRRAVNQQYAVNLSGGSDNDQYYFSEGWDKNLNNTVASDYSRVTLNANNTHRLFNQRLEINTGVLFSINSTGYNNGFNQPAYPYEMLADGAGRPLKATQTYRNSVKDTIGQGKLLDWGYYPLNELQRNGVNNTTDYRLNMGLGYQVIPSLRLTVNYQFEKAYNDGTLDYPVTSYYARNLINSFSQIDAAGNVIRPVPLGGMENISNSNYRTHYGRAQANYENTFAQKHAVNALAGVEIRDYASFNRGYTVYGYNPATATSAPVDFVNRYPTFVEGNQSRISGAPSQSGTADRVFSYYGNASYTYDERYMFSASTRKDESNLFGVRANQKGVPLYSLGLGYIISEENFYHVSWLPYLKLRITDGYNGNLSKTVSAYTTANSSAGTSYYFNQPYQTIINPPNPSLRWEKVHVVNVGVDYAMKNNRLSGSLEYYNKKGIDLIGNSPIAPQTGVVQFTGNTADLLTKGVDVTVNSRNLRGRLQWNTALLLNYVTDKVTSYKVKQGSNVAYINSNYENPMEGKPYAAVFAYKWAGLDGAGNPQGYLNGKVSEDYAGISNSTDISQLAFKGSSVPNYTGSLRNTFTYKGVELSFLITGKFGYYFRRGSINYTSLFANNYQQADFDKRWQLPGDELKTSVPSMIYPTNPSRDGFYTGSEILVERGDHIRLQDVRLSYDVLLKPAQKGAGVKMQFYLYASNLGIIWKANKSGLDPDAVDDGLYFIPNPRSISFGVKADF